MSKRQWLMIFGALVIIMPFTGFPSFWTITVLVILGFLIVAVAYMMGGTKTNTNSSSKTNTLPYSEHQNFPSDKNPSSDLQGEHTINNSSNIIEK